MENRALNGTQLSTKMGLKRKLIHITFAPPPHPTEKQTKKREKNK